MEWPKVRHEGANVIWGDLFGRQHEVAWSLSAGLNEYIIIGWLDGNAHPGLTVHLEVCKFSSERINYIADLNSLAALQQMV